MNNKTMLLNVFISLISITFSAFPNLENKPLKSSEWVHVENSDTQTNLEQALQIKTHPFKLGIISANDGTWKLGNIENNIKSYNPHEIEVFFINQPNHYGLIAQRIFQYVGPDKQGDKYIVLVAVHGTGSNFKSFGADSSQAMSKDIYIFAKLLAHAYKQSVKLISYDWSGALSHSVRQAAGLALGSRLAQEKNRSAIWTMAHSHGCNVVNHAALIVPIDHAIHIASPAIDQTALDGIKNYQTVFNFYSTGDLVQILGSMQTCWHPKRKIVNAVNSDTKLYNIRVKLNKKDLGHGLITHNLIKNLPAIISSVEISYNIYHDLDMELISHDKLPIISIKSELNRVMPGQKEFTQDKNVSEILTSKDQEQKYSSWYGSTKSKKANNWSLFSTDIKHYGSKLVNKLFHNAQTK